MTINININLLAQHKYDHLKSELAVMDVTSETLEEMKKDVTTIREKGVSDIDARIHAKRLADNAESMLAVLAYQVFEIR